MALSFSLHAQQVNCTTSAVPALLRSEGVTERIGDILMSCTGAAAGSVTGALTLFTTTTVITNRVSPSGTTDVQVLLETGGSPQLLNTSATLGSANSVNISGINFTAPASGSFSLRITNVRVNAYQAASQPIRVQLASTGTTAFRVDSSQVTAGLPSPGLLASFAATFICNTSPGPDVVTFSSLISKGTRFASIRVSEGATNAASFEKRSAGTDSGTRIAVRYSGFPAGARLFVPDVIAGSDATISTAGGDLGLPTNGGSYTPSAQGSLLLARVRGTDANGAGGSPAYTPAAAGSPTVNFDGASEVALSNGSGIAVFEVMDSSPSTRESAQFPTFLVYQSPGDGSTASGNVQISFAPISADSVASTSAPVPRFQAVTPAPDCQSLGDCNSGVFPVLSINSDSLNVSAFTNSGPQVRYVRVNNLGGSLLNWTAAIAYQNGTGWLTIDPPSGLNNATIRIDYNPGKLAPGTYNATLTVDAGPIAGSKTAPIQFVVSAPILPTLPIPTITSMVNAASFADGPLVSGSLASIFGADFGSGAPIVSFDDLTATVFYSSATQINLRVPDLGAKTTAQVVITASDGRKSTARAVTLAQSWPGIFNPGVLNQDNTVNAAANPAPAGSVIQVYATGLGLNLGNVTAKLGVETIPAPRYAGPAPGFAGLQQVNLDVPASISGTSADLMLCTGSICSPPVRVYVRPAQ